MPVNKKKIIAATMQSGRVLGIRAPSASMSASEILIGSRTMGLWEHALDAAIRAVPKPDAAQDSQAEIAKIISSVYRNYSGLTRLNQQLKARYEADDKYHRQKFLADINNAIGVSIKDILSERGSTAVVHSQLVESMRLIKTLDGELVKALAAEVWAGIQRGDDALSIKKFILERKSDYPEWRAKLIARDQTGKLFSQLTEERQTDIGLEEYIWDTVRDGAVRDEHAARQGKTFRWDKPPEDGSPGTAIQCRCVASVDIATLRRALGQAA